MAAETYWNPLTYSEWPPLTYTFLRPFLAVNTVNLELAKLIIPSGCLDGIYWVLNGRNILVHWTLYFSSIPKRDLFAWIARGSNTQAWFLCQLELFPCRSSNSGDLPTWGNVNLGSSSCISWLPSVSKWSPRHGRCYTSKAQQIVLKYQAADNSLQVWTFRANQILFAPEVLNPQSVQLASRQLVDACW